jgi:hypothetical protein
MTEPIQWFVGIDWGSTEHAVCVMSASGTVQGERRVPHEATAVHACLTWILTETAAAPEHVAVAIERPHGAQVDTALEHGMVLYAIHPTQLDRFRDRFTAAGAKDDRRDALVLADSLRTDRRAFRRIVLDAPVILQLKDLARAEDELKRDLRRLTNRLRDQVYRVAPPLVALSPALDEAWVWTLLERASTPAQLRRVSRATLAQILKQHRVRRLPATELYDALHAPAFALAPGVIEAAREVIALLLPQIRTVEAQRHRCVSGQQRLLAVVSQAPTDPTRHRDVEILTSFPGVGRMVTVTMLGEAAQLLATRDYHRLRALSGSAPVTAASGKRRLVFMRRACNRRLREALYHWARVSLQRDAGALAYYRAQRHRGHSHGQALRAVANRWLRILVATLTTGSLYDASRLHRADSQVA